jgi:hypothetical protein
MNNDNQYGFQSRQDAPSGEVSTRVVSSEVTKMRASDLMPPEDTNNILSEPPRDSRRLPGLSQAAIGNRPVE